MTGRRASPASNAGSVLCTLLVVPVFVVALGATAVSWRAPGAGGHDSGPAHGAWRTEQAVVVSGRAVVPVRPPVSPRTAPLLAVLPVLLLGLALTWRRPRRSGERPRPLAARPCQAPRGPPLLAVV